MIPRKRVETMFSFHPVDKPVIDCIVMDAAYYEHGEKLLDLMRSLDGDFGHLPDGSNRPLPKPEDYDEEGRYCVTFVDAWGTTWHKRIFGIMGHPIAWPLDDWAKLDDYKFPEQKRLTDAEAAVLRAESDNIREQGYYTIEGWVDYFERTHAVRRFEDVLMDIATRDENFLRFTERLHEYNKIAVENMLKTGVDCIRFAGDFGTEQALIISPKDFRKIYKPLLTELVDIVKKAGKRAIYHSCGYIVPLLADFKEIGFDGLWPQLDVHNLSEFAAQCRELLLAVAIHPGRRALMSLGTPEDVKKRIREYHDLFKPNEGGAWYHLEIDNDFPYENIEAMVETIRALRN